MCAYPADNGFCVGHVHDFPDYWAQNNKIMCDMLHRGVSPARVDQGEPDHYLM